LFYAVGLRAYPLNGNELAAVLVFLASITLINLRVIEEAVAALAGLIFMIILTSYGPVEAFHYIDWNIIAILFGMWLITAYMNRAGFAEAVVSAVAKRVRSYHSFLVSMMLLAGFISIFVDNVLVILLLGSIVIEAAKRNGGNPALAVLMIGFSANFMGTALLMGDLPPQLLHSIGKAEFLDFIWFRGKPSSFPLLTITFLIVTGLMYLLLVRKEPNTLGDVGSESQTKVNRGLLLVSTAFFIGTVVGMAIRPMLGVPLGFITVAGASLLALTVEVWRRLGGEGLPSFEDVILDVEWRALLFYATLFGLVGGLEYTGALRDFAKALTQYIAESLPVSYSIFYWTTGLLAAIVEHDALLLTMLYTVRDAACMAGVDPWPFYWCMAWAATLASNATVAAAPALYVAVALAEKAGYRITARRFLSYSLPYAFSSLAIHYLLTLPVWGVH
jgi:Na+/H+ antiporter NhaD/arsenite permease-like protein